MKESVKRLVRTTLVPPARAAAPLGEMCRLHSLAMLARHAWWKARLAGMGEGTVIYPRVVIHGADTVRVGRKCAIAEYVHMWGGGGITIGDEVLIASHAMITSQTHDKHAARFRESLVKAPVHIGDNVWIGAGAIILPGVTIGSGSIVGAGAVVTRDVPERSVVVGVPARIVEHLERGTINGKRA